MINSNIDDSKESKIAASIQDPGYYYNCKGGASTHVAFCAAGECQFFATAHRTGDTDSESSEDTDNEVK